MLSCECFPMQVMTANIAPLNSIECFAIVGGLSVINVSIVDGDDERTAIVPSLVPRSASECFLEGMYLTNGVAFCFCRCVLTTLCLDEIVGATTFVVAFWAMTICTSRVLQHPEQQNASVYGFLRRLVFLRHMAHVGVCAGASKAQDVAFAS